MLPKRNNPSPLSGNFRQDLVHLSRPSNPTSPSTPGESIYSRQSSESDITSISSVEDNLPDRPLQPGIYIPTVVFFQPETEDLDIATIKSHAIRLAKAGIAGITTQGSNGEAVHLSRQERKTVTRSTRQALDANGFTQMPIIVGCGAQSTREAIELCHDALQSGGDYALVLPPSYYKGLVSQESLLDFFNDVADKSPIPLLIYNFPGAAGGIDFTSDTINTLAKHHNIVGCKLTCGNTGKLARVAAATDAATPSNPGSGFMCMGGSADFTLQTLVVGGSGVICGMANIAPKASVRLVKLWQEGKINEAQKLQAVVARGDWAAITGGLVGTKAALQAWYGYGGVGRKPLPAPSKAETEKWKEAFKELVLLENSLE